MFFFCLWQHLKQLLSAAQEWWPTSLWIPEKLKPTACSRQLAPQTCVQSVAMSHRQAPMGGWDMRGADGWTLLLHDINEHGGSEAQVVTAARDSPPAFLPEATSAKRQWTVLVEITCWKAIFLSLGECSGRAFEGFLEPSCDLNLFLFGSI